MTGSKLNGLIETYKSEGLFASRQIKQEELISFTFHSTSIEGSSLTYEEVYSLINDKISAARPLADNDMNIDHAEAYKYALSEFYKEPKLSEEFIQRVNALVMKRTGKFVNTPRGSYDEKKGDFRLTSVSIGKRYFPHHVKIKKLISELCISFNQEIWTVKSNINKLNLTADLHYNFVSIHPFSDGNGRSARILMNAVLFYFDLPRLILKSERKKLYYEALEETRNKSDLSVFRKYIYNEYSAQLQNEIEKYRESEKNNMFLTF